MAGNVLPLVARPWGFNHWAPQSLGAWRDEGDPMGGPVIHGAIRAIWWLVMVVGE